MKKKGILSLLAFLLSFTLLSSTVVYAVEDVPQNSDENMEDIQKPDNESDDNEKVDDIDSVTGQENVVQDSEDKEREVSDEGNPTANMNHYPPESRDTGSDGSADVQGHSGRPYGWYFDQTEKNWYFYDNQGNKQPGWLYWGNKWYYFDKDNEQYPYAMAADCKLEIGQKTYFFNTDGVMLTGWVKRQEGWYFADGNGIMVTGWRKIDGKWYYLDASNDENPGLMISNCRYELGNATYFFNGSGVMLTGWVRYPEGWYYAGGGGAMLTGWQKIGGKWYYLDGSNNENPGLMISNGRYKIGNATYFFNGSGVMLTGWVRYPEGWYYAGGGGAMLTGWQKIGGKWYYLDGSNAGNPGLMIYGGWQKIGSLWYYFDKSGRMSTGWLKLNGKWYYLGTDGSARSGWQRVGRDWYYFYPDTNALAVNTIVDGYQMGSDGKMGKIASGSSRLKWLFPAGLPVTPVQMQLYLTTIKVPVIDENGKSSTIQLTIHKKLVREITAVFNELKAIGFPVRKSDTAAYNWRNMASGSSRSHHSYGCVVDLNWNSNPMIGVTAGSYRPGKDPYSVTSRVVQIWKNHGFYWGGDWKTTKDYMHFTYTNH